MSFRIPNLLPLLLLVTGWCSSIAGANAFVSRTTLSQFLVGKTVTRKSSSCLPATTLVDQDVKSTTLPTWDDLQVLLDNAQPDKEATPLVTLYRDTNGWCPFCERVWLALEIKQIPYQEQLINLRDKPSWFLQMVPTGLVPAVLFHNDKIRGNNNNGGNVPPETERSLVWESLDIIRALDEQFPETPRLVREDHADYQQARDVTIQTTSAGVQFLYGGRNGTLSQDETAERQRAFEHTLGELDAFLGRGGPFCLGDTLSGVDIEMIPTMERWRHQLPLTANMTIYDETHYPNIVAWFQALEHYPPYYRRVMGDAYSWTAVASTFLRYFATGPNGTMTETTRQAIERADAAAQALTASFQTPAVEYDDEAAGLARREAASKILSNHEAIVNDCTNTDPQSQTELPRASNPTAADAALRMVTYQLLTGNDSMCPVAEVLGGDAALSLQTVAARLCVPRDMGAPAAQVLRQTLMHVADSIEEAGSES